MTAKKRATVATSNPIGSDLKKVDEYVLGPKDYDEIPELTDEWFRRADIYEGGKLVRRGRRPSPVRKRPVSLRLDPDVIGWFKRTGKGYQSRMGAVLRSYVEAKRKRSA